MDFIRKIGKYIVVGLLPGIAWFIINFAINGHYHKLPNGEVIHHSHPYKHNKNNKLPFEDHHHTDSEYFILDQISKPLFLLNILFILHLITSSFKEINLFNVLNLPSKKYCFSNNYRSPPVP